MGMKRISIGRFGPGWASLSLFVLMAAGCRQADDAPWETFAQGSEAYKPQPNSGNAWDGYLLAANLASAAAGPMEKRGDLKPSEEAEFARRLQNSVAVAVRASTLPCRAEFRPHDPFLPRKSGTGFTAIGRALGIQIKQAGAGDSANSAAGPLIAAHRMADHLAQGDADDALVGFWIASNARAQAADLLQRMDASSLQKVGNAILSSLAQSPSPNQTVEHEYSNMLEGVQFVQDAYKSRDFKLLRDAFYHQADPAIEYLEGMRPSDRPKYFKGFAAEAKAYLDWSVAALAVPASERKPVDLSLSGERPWRRFSMHLFTPLTSFVEARDLHLARSRLFALTCLALASGKATGTAPIEFVGLPDGSTTDPYSGKPFPYHRAEREFKIYSVGADGRDDGGETRGRGMAPDLIVEGPGQG